MRFGSVCSGIEAASVAWHPLGWEAAWLAEIEPFPSAVLKHHYPDVPNYGDMTALPDRIRSGEVDAPDLFCGGTPCQAFSVAGKRQSLADARGNLSLTFCDIADAIDESRSVRGLPATIVFWENVPGVLSTGDNAFGCFLAQLCGGDEPLYAPDGWPDAGCVSGPSRTAAWRVLDAQYFGLAQRRRRVFVVASARERFDPAAVLFEFDGVRRDTAPSREAGQRVAANVDASLDVSCAGTLTAGFGKLGAPDAGPQGKEYLLDGSAYCMDNRGQPQAVVQPVGFDSYNHAVTGDVSKTLDVGQDYHHVPNVFQPIAFHPTQDPSRSTEVCHGANENATAAVLAPTLTASNDPSRSPQSSEITAQVAAVFEATSAVAFQIGPQSGEFTDVAPTLDCRAKNGPIQNQLGAGVMQAMQVRRLTPVECERLQGFPDNYTAIPWRGKDVDNCPDGPRYKALGNSWAVPVVRWIGKRIDSAIRSRT